jgi:hypothetical protein
MRPPEYASDEARQQGIDLCWLDDPAQRSLVTKTCCVTKSSSGKLCCCCHHDDHAAMDGGKTASHLIVWKALACGGQSANWLAAVPTLVAVRLDIADRLPLISWLRPHSSLCADGIADEPAVPPPERA